MMQEVEKRFQGDVPLLDPVEDMGIKDKALKDIVKVTRKLGQQLPGMGTICDLMYYGKDFHRGKNTLFLDFLFCCRKNV